MKVTVVGAGVVGLTSALELVRAGADVRIVAREPAARTTSALAAALWYPYEAFPADRVSAWALRSFEVFRDMARDADPRSTGVTMHEGVELCRDPAAEPCDALRRLDLDILGPADLPTPYHAGWRADLPIVEMPIYLPWLERQLEERGVRTNLQDVRDLRELEGGADVIVNCTGLGARELCDDDAVFPIRGQIVRMESFGRRAWEIFGLDGDEMGYMIPRSSDIILGRTDVPAATTLDPDDGVTRAILSACSARDARVESGRVLDVLVGLRPGRHEVRLDTETLSSGTRVIHCYGHGGAGITLSIGCAEEVRDLALG